MLDEPDSDKYSDSDLSIHSDSDPEASDSDLDPSYGTNHGHEAANPLESAIDAPLADVTLPERQETGGQARPMNGTFRFYPPGVHNLSDGVDQSGQSRIAYLQFRIFPGVEASITSTEELHVDQATVTSIVHADYANQFAADTGVALIRSENLTLDRLRRPHKLIESKSPFVDPVPLGSGPDLSLIPGMLTLILINWKDRTLTSRSQCKRQHCCAPLQMRLIMRTLPLYPRLR